MPKFSLPKSLLAALLALGTLASFWPAMRCGFVNFDDPDFVTANVQVQKGLTWETMKWAWLNPVNATWHPLTVLSHALDCQLFALNPWGHHFTSVLLHALNAALFFALLQLMTRATWRSLIAAAFFALHPLRVESVAWVAERKDVLSGFFGLLALLAYARYAGSPKPEVRSQKSEVRSQKSGITFHVSRFTFHAPRFTLHASRFYLLSLFFFACGLMSKPMLVTLPFVMLLLDYWPLGRMQKSEVRGPKSEVRSQEAEGRMQNAAAGDTQHAPRNTDHVSRFTFHVSLLAEKLPYFLLAALGSVATFVVQRSAGAMTGAGGLPLGARAGNALISYCRYLGKLFWPMDLAVFYPHPGHWPTVKVVLAGVLILCLTLLVWARRHRAPHSLIGWLWFVGMLVPVIGFVQVGEQAMADRYTYLPSLGVMILFVWGTCELVQGKAEDSGQRAEGSGQRSEDSGQTTEDSDTQHATRNTPHVSRTRVQSQIANRKSQILLWASGVGLSVCLALTRQQLGYWKDGESLFRHAIAVTKDNWMAYNNLGGALEEQGQLDEAIRLYREGIRLDPKSADSHNNLGIALGKQGQIDEAIRQFQAALRLQPDHADAHNNLGNALLGKGQTDAAIDQLQEAIRLRPGNAAAHFNLGVGRMSKRQVEEAIRQYQEALRLDPGYAQAHNNLGIAFAARGQFDLAIDQFQQALRFNPDYADARKNLDIALAAKARSAQPPGATTNR